MCLAVQTIQGPPGDKKKRKGKRQQIGRAFFVMKKRKILNGGKKRTQFGGPKESKARRACQKAMLASARVCFRPYQPDKGASKDFLQNKGRGKDRKGKGKEGTFPQSRFSASETPDEEGYGQAWESDDWSVSH